MQSNKYLSETNFTIGKNGDIDVDIPKINVLIKEQLLLFDQEMEIEYNFKKIIVSKLNYELGAIIKLNNEIELMFVKQQIIAITSKLTLTTNLVEISNLISGYENYPEYTNSPRVVKRCDESEIKLETPPEKDKDSTKSSVMKKLIPAVVGIIIAILMLKLRPRGIRGVVMLAATMVSFIISMINLYTDYHEKRAHNKKRRDVYNQYLTEKRVELTKRRREEISALNYNNLNQSAILSEIKNQTYRLYEKDCKDKDFLTLRLGLTNNTTKYSLKDPFDKIQLNYDNLELELKELYEEYKTIEDAPLVINCRENNLGLIGSNYVIQKQIHALLTQLYFYHSYLDLNIVIITSEKNKANYEYLRWLKHMHSPSNNLYNIIYNGTTRDQLLTSYTQILRTRKQAEKEVMFSPHILFIMDNYSLVQNHPIMEFLQEDNIELGTSVMYIAKDEAMLPNNVQTIVKYVNDEVGELVLNQEQLINQQFRLEPAQTNTEILDYTTRKLGQLTHIKGIKSSIPTKLGFLEMYNVKDVKDLAIAKRWEKNKSYKSLAAPLGKKSETDYINLDLHEKVHGPHGLIAGTTGSGKSEVIQTYILSLALNYSPYEVGFLLIDYKGGGMANLFKDMPHHLGSITNLDGYQSMRALASIKSELKRRQQIFSDNNVNHINGYHKLFEAKKVNEPLPHLFLISDEFAELKSEQPEFMKELVSAARIGRSLGIHLILATQKPSGVVDEQIWSNSKFKLSLKVAEESDSKELLRTPDAAYIKEPGRGYLKVGTNELYELFQSGYSGAEYGNDDSTQVDNRVYLIDEVGQRQLLNQEEVSEELEVKEAITELDAVLKAIKEVYDEKEFIEIPKPWLAPLPDFSEANYDEKISEALDLKVTLGLIDIPNQQSQINYEIDFINNGQFAIFGAQQSGKTSTILTMILKLTNKNKPSNLKIFIFDLGNSGLIHLADLKHTVEYITLNDEDKQRMFLENITKEINERKNVFAKEKVGTLKAYNQITLKPLPAIIIPVDNYDLIGELDDDVQEIIKTLIKEGTNLGIYIIISATKSNAVKNAILSSFKQKLLLYVTEKGEVATILKRSEYELQELPGRGLVEVDNVEVVQIDYPINSNEEQDFNDLMKDKINEINNQYQEENSGFKTMPEMIYFENQQMSNNEIYIGKSYSNIEDLSIPLTTTHISGYSMSGKTNLIRMIIEQIKTKLKITIIDDTAFSLAEYSETENINYVTDLEEIEYDSDVYIINKFNRLDKVKRKEQEALYEKLFMLHLQGKIFIAETGDKGLGKNKADIYDALRNAPNYIYFGNPLNQKLILVEKAKFRKEKVGIGEGYYFSARQINKFKTPLVPKSDQEIKIPGLNTSDLVPEFTFKDVAIAGENNQEFIESVIRKNPEKHFKIISATDFITTSNSQIISISELNNLEKDDILVINTLKPFNELSIKEKRNAFMSLDELEGKVTLLLIIEEKIKGNSVWLKQFKKPDNYILTSNPAKIKELGIFRINNRKLLSAEYRKDTAFQVMGKDYKIIKIK